MNRWRLSALAAVFALVVSFALSGSPASAQTSTGEAHIGVYVCTVTPGNATSIGSSLVQPAGFTGCAASDIDSREWGLRVDGRRPDSFSGYMATWTNLADGSHVATTGYGASYTFTVSGGLVELAAWYDESLVGPASEALQLPNTGTGTQVGEHSIPVAALFMAIATAAAGGSWLLRTRRAQA